MKKIYDYTLGAACVILTITLIYMAFVGPKTVEIDEKRFNCTKADVNGIEAKCTQYTAVSWAR